MATSEFKRLYKKRQKFPPQWTNTYSSTVNIGLITHPVFLSLSPAAKLICIVTQIENQRAAHNKHKEANRPFFEWTAFDSETNLHISRRHHFNAINELKAKGFIEVLQPGGLRGCNGTGNVYALSSAWKRYQVPEKAIAASTVQKMAKARKQIGKQQQKPMNEIAQVEEVEAAKPMNTVAQVKKSKNLESFKKLPPYLSWEQPQPGMRAYMREDGSVRATQIKLVEPISSGDIWLIQFNRKGSQSAFKAGSLPFADIVPVDRIKPKEYQNQRPE
jgi:hypothetical protein